MNTLEMKSSGRTMAFTIAGADCDEGTSPAVASPRAAKDAAPRTRTRPRAGSAAGSRPTPKKAAPKAATMAASSSPMRMLWMTRAARYAPVGSGVPWMRLRSPSSRAMATVMASVVKPALTMAKAMMAGV
jgi:hypothetical protein